MDVMAKDVSVGRFFATADQPHGNVFIMRVRATSRNDGLCERLNDNSLWQIRPNRRVRLLMEDEYDGTRFYV